MTENGLNGYDLYRIRLEAQEGYKAYLYARFQNGVRDGEATLTEAEYIQWYIDESVRKMSQSEDILPPFFVASDTEKADKSIPTAPISVAPPTRPKSDDKPSFFSNLFSGKGKRSAEKESAPQGTDELPTVPLSDRTEESVPPTEETEQSKGKTKPKKRMKPSLKKGFLIVLICYLIIMGIFASIIFINTVNLDAKQDVGTVSAEEPNGEIAIIQVMPREEEELSNETLFDKFCDMLR